MIRRVSLLEREPAGDRADRLSLWDVLVAHQAYFHHNTYRSRGVTHLIAVHGCSRFSVRLFRFDFRDRSHFEFRLDRAGYAAENFNPTIPARIRTRHMTRHAVSGSEKRTMPSMAVPTAPIPVQTA